MSKLTRREFLLGSIAATFLAGIPEEANALSPEEKMKICILLGAMEKGSKEAREEWDAFIGNYVKDFVYGRRQDGSVTARDLGHFLEVSDSRNGAKFSCYMKYYGIFDYIVKFPNLMGNKRLLWTLKDQTIHKILGDDGYRSLSNKAREHGKTFKNIGLLPKNRWLLHVYPGENVEHEFLLSLTAQNNNNFSFQSDVVLDSVIQSVEYVKHFWNECGVDRMKQLYFFMKSKEIISKVTCEDGKFTIDSRRQEGLKGDKMVISMNRWKLNPDSCEKLSSSFTFLTLRPTPRRILPQAPPFSKPGLCEPVLDLLV